MSVCSLRWFAEDMVSVGKWLVRETTDEVHARFWKALERLDTRMQPAHVRQAWDGMLAAEAVERVRAEAQGVTECVEAPDYRGDADRMSAAYIPGSVAASATDRPAGVEPTSPEAPPVGHPPMPPYREVFVPDEDRALTSELLYQGAVYADIAAALIDGSDQGDDHPYRVDSKAMRRRADMFAAVENTP